MDDFYAARSRSIPPLPWPTIAPPFSQLRGIVVDAKHTFEASFMPGMYKTGPFIRPGDAYTGKAAPADLPPILDAQQIEDVVAYLLTLKE